MGTWLVVAQLSPPCTLPVLPLFMMSTKDKTWQLLFLQGLLCAGSLADTHRPH